MSGGTSSTNTAQNSASNSISNALFGVNSGTNSATNTAQNSASASGPSALAQQYLGAGTTPTSSTLQNYYNPYQQSVINSTMQQLGMQQGISNNQIVGNAVSNNALGGSRQAVAQGYGGYLNNLAAGSTLSNLNSQNYSQALAAAQNEAGLNLQAAGLAGTQGASSSTGSTIAQQLASELGSSSQAGASASAGTGTSNTATTPGILGDIGLGLGLFGLSDERVKEDITPVGKTNDGQTIYKYRFRGHPKYHIGLLAQEVEKKHPDAVGNIGGLKGVDYDKATESSERQKFDSGGSAFAIPQMPQLIVAPLPNMPSSGQQSQQSSAQNMFKMGQQAGQALFGSSSPTTTSAGGWQTGTQTSGLMGSGGLGSSLSGLGNSVSSGLPDIGDSIAGLFAGGGSARAGSGIGGIGGTGLGSPALSLPNMPTAQASMPSISAPSISMPNIGQAVLPSVPMPSVPFASAPAASGKGTGGAVRDFARGGLVRSFADGGDSGLELPGDVALGNPDAPQSGGLSGLYQSFQNWMDPSQHSGQTVADRLVASIPAQPAQPQAPAASSMAALQTPAMPGLTQSVAPAQPITQAGLPPEWGGQLTPMAGSDLPDNSGVGISGVQPQQGLAGLVGTTQFPQAQAPAAAQTPAAQAPGAVHNPFSQDQQPIAGRHAVAKTISDEWANAGMSKNGIGGMLANVADESGFDPTLRHPDQPHWGGEAHYAHGLFQEGGAEWNHYQQWLDENHTGAGWRDPRLQAQFTAENLKANYPGVWKQMNEAKTPGEAAQAFVSGYLKPAKQFEMARRNQYGQGVPSVDDYLSGAYNMAKRGLGALGSGAQEAGAGVLGGISTATGGLRDAVQRGFSGDRAQGEPYQDQRDQGHGNFLQGLFGGLFNPLNLDKDTRTKLMQAGAMFSSASGNQGMASTMTNIAGSGRQAQMDAARLNLQMSQANLASRGSWHPIDLDGKAGLINEYTGELKETPQYSHLATPSRGGANAGGVYEFKRSAYLAVHPGDTSGALEYAAGRKTMGASDIQKSAIGFAQRDAAAQGLFGQKYQDYVNQRRQFYEDAMRQGSQQQAESSQAAPAAKSSTGSASKFQEGQTATGPNGQKVVYQNGKWVPVQ